jgi:hypothetical protein
MLAAGPFTVFKIYERSYMLSSIPDALNVTSITYSKEDELWGIGPGANEAGIRVYELPKQVANEISERGIEFFNNLPPNQNRRDRRWSGSFYKWNQTPISPDKDWIPKESKKNLDIYDYICRYTCIDIDSTVSREANEIVNNVGSYYAYGRIGLIIVNPSKKLVLYMYNG